MRKMIDTCCTHSCVVNSWVTEPNLIKFLHEKLLPINVLKPELRYSNLFRNASVTNEGDGSTNCDRVAAVTAHFTFVSLWYLLDQSSHQIFPRCSGIIAAVNACIYNFT